MLRFDTSDAEQGLKVPSLDTLPPLPTPHYREMRSEAACGCATVAFLSGGLVALTHAITFDGMATKPLSTAAAVVYALLLAEAAAAWLCLLGLLLADPGTVRRSAAACFPLPAEVEARLLAGEPLGGMGNVRSEGRTFCVRCCVWRESGASRRFAHISSTHHCETCQRCVRDFDHHCGVFGRCIAGKGLRGNMKYFKTLLVLAVLGVVTCLTSLVVKAA